MRLLLAGILTLTPLVAHATFLDHAGDSDHDSPAMEIPPPDDGSDSLSDSVGLSRNPYSPASPTNFEPFIGPYLYIQGQHEWVLYDPQTRETYTIQNWEPGRFYPGHTRSSDGISPTHGFSQPFSMSVGWPGAR